MAKVVIVEDDPMISEIYSKKFSDVGFDVSAVTSGEQVLDLALAEKVDVILLDLIMPKMDGFEVIRKLRDGMYDPNIKIIVTSNLSSHEDQDKAMKLGANGFVAKSDYSPSELVIQVKRLINQFSEQKKNEAKLNGSVSASVPRGGKKRILMIEDEEIIIDMFGEKLKQDGYDVVFARNGAWGVKEPLKEKFDLYIIDMMMPAMTGEEMVTRLKMEEETKNVPTIMLSASVEEQYVKKMEELGISAFFGKTQITPSELSNRVAELLK
jgi:two-component system, OmpR family, alkaline phosphatase synthesis response regulator PhoP